MLKGSLQVPGTNASNLGDGGGKDGGRGREHGGGRGRGGVSRSNRVGYVRSLSSPADSLSYGRTKSSQQSSEPGQRSTVTGFEGVVGMQLGEVNQMMKAQLVTAGSAIKEEALDAVDEENRSSQISPTQVPVSQSNNLAKRSSKHVEFEDEQQASVGGKTLNSVSGVLETEKVDATAVGIIPTPPELPKMFNFFEMRSGSDVPVEEKEKDVQQGKALPEGDKDNVFVFSASSPASPPLVSGKRKNAVVRFSFSGGSEGESHEGEGEGEGAEEMAMLAQQLELESDNVS